jgi:hypothetical protein
VLTYEEPNPDTLLERTVVLVAVVGTICGAVLCVVAGWVLWLLDRRDCLCVSAMRSGAGKSLSFSFTALPVDNSRIPSVPARKHVVSSPDKRMFLNSAYISNGSFDTSNVSLDIPSKSLDIPARSLDILSKSLNIPARSFDILSKSLDIPARSFDMSAKLFGMSAGAFYMWRKTFDIFAKSCDVA